MVIIGIVLYIIMALGCAIGGIEKWTKAEFIASLIVGIFWPVLIAAKFFKWVFSH